MPLYESTFIARQEITSQDVDKLTEDFTQVVTDLKGKIVKKEYWGLRNLAYLIKKNRKGHYVMLGIDASPECVKELQRRYKLSEDVIRELTLRVEEIDNDPSVIMKNAKND